MSSRRSPGPLRPLREDVRPALRALVVELRAGYEKANLNFAELAGPAHSSRASVSRWLNGQALPGCDQALAWADACGTDRDLMVDLWRAAETEWQNPDPPGRPEPAPADGEGQIPEVPERRRRTWSRASRISAAIAASAAVSTIVAVLLSHSPEDVRLPPSSSPCQPYSARVTAPPAADTTFDITIDVMCPPPAGRVFWLFIRGDNIGDHGTTNYYPNFRMRAGTGRQVTQNFVKPSDPDGERFYLVVSVAESVSATLTNKREFINGLPPSGEITSASVRTVISHPPQPQPT